MKKVNILNLIIYICKYLRFKGYNDCNIYATFKEIIIQYEKNEIYSVTAEKIIAFILLYLMNIMQFNHIHLIRQILSLFYVNKI